MVKKGELREDLKKYQFKKGQSGNPKGRPKNKTVSEYLRDLLGEIDPKSKKEIAELVALAMIKYAIKGNKTYLSELLNRTEGKVPDTLAGADGGALDVIVRYVDGSSDE